MRPSARGNRAGWEASGSSTLTGARHATTLRDMIRGILLDLAGVIYDGDKPLPGALDAVARLRHSGLALRFVTNTTRMPKRKVLQRLAALGLDVAASELFTPAEAARSWLAANDNVYGLRIVGSCHVVRRWHRFCSRM